MCTEWGHVHRQDILTRLLETDHGQISRHIRNNIIGQITKIILHSKIHLLAFQLVPGLNLLSPGHIFYQTFHSLSLT